jgi:hypothetical protein
MEVSFELVFTHILGGLSYPYRADSVSFGVNPVGMEDNPFTLVIIPSL